MENRPQYRVAAAGLDPRDVRLIEIVFKHSQYNRYAFRFEPKSDPLGIDILIVNPLSPEGLRAVARMRSAGCNLPVISVVPHGATSSARHTISIDRLTLQLLPILNRVVEVDLRAPKGGAAPVGAGDPRGEHSTREFLREAARKSREGDQARELATRARGAVSAAAAAGANAAQAGAAAPQPDPAAPASSNLVAFPRSGEPAPPRIRVLVVDDSPTVRQQLSIAFSRMGVLCEAVGGAEDALARLQVQHYDLVLVDVVMPGVDGYKLTRQIRRRHRGVPVIILTSRSSPFDLARGALAGCNSYLVKPVPLRQLEAAVVKQLRRSLAIDDLTGLLRLTPERLTPERAQPAGEGRANPAGVDAGTMADSSPDPLRRNHR